MKLDKQLDVCLLSTLIFDRGFLANYSLMEMGVFWPCRSYIAYVFCPVNRIGRIDSIKSKDVMAFR